LLTLFVSLNNLLKGTETRQERDDLFANKSLDEIVSEIEKRRK
jgi:hypothetical protein